MVKSVKDLAMLDVQLNVEERNLLSVAYKNVVCGGGAVCVCLGELFETFGSVAPRAPRAGVVCALRGVCMVYVSVCVCGARARAYDVLSLSLAQVGARRASWRVLSSIEAKEKDKGDSSKVSRISEYRKVVEAELENICHELLEVLEKHLLKADKTCEGQVFYLKMAGDYHRYLAEFATADKRKAQADQAKLKYQQASDKAKEEDLPPTNPIRLGLALNYSVSARARWWRSSRGVFDCARARARGQVFFYEILNEPDTACKLAKDAFDDAISELDSLQEEQYKDATLIMQLIRDNLTLWTSDAADENDGKGADDGTNVEDLDK